MAVIVGGTTLTTGAAIQSSWKNVGSYVWATHYNPENADSTTTASSSYKMYASNVGTTYNNGYNGGNSANWTSSGTWRACGYTSGYANNNWTNATLWQRIS